MKHGNKAHYKSCGQNVAAATQNMREYTNVIYEHILDSLGIDKL